MENPFRICSIQSLLVEEIQEWLSALEEALKAAVSV